MASGTLNMARQIGSIIGVALFGSLSAVDVVAGLRMSLTISIALGLLVSYSVRWRSPTRHHPVAAVPTSVSIPDDLPTVKPPSSSMIALTHASLARAQSAVTRPPR